MTADDEQLTLGEEIVSWIEGTCRVRRKRGHGEPRLVCRNGTVDAAAALMRSGLRRVA